MNMRIKAGDRLNVKTSKDYTADQTNSMKVKK